MSWVSPCWGNGTNSTLFFSACWSSLCVFSFQMFHILVGSTNWLTECVANMLLCIRVRAGSPTTYHTLLTVESAILSWLLILAKSQLFVWTWEFPPCRSGLDYPQSPHCTEQAASANHATGCLYKQCLNLLENHDGHQLFSHCLSIDHLKEAVWIQTSIQTFNTELLCWQRNDVSADTTCLAGSFESWLRAESGPNTSD